MSRANTHVALLRGINVGGKNKLPMKDLSAVFVDAGATDVRTYIQSGNVVFRASPALAQKIPALVATEIAARFSLAVPVVQRSAIELSSIVSEPPFAVDLLHVAFLADVPSAERVASLDPQRSPGDSLVVRGRDAFLHLPNGVGKTKITNAWLDSKLATTSTLRSWRTVLALLELTQ